MIRNHLFIYTPTKVPEWESAEDHLVREAWG